MLLDATLAITPIACAVPVFGGFLPGAPCLLDAEPGLDLDEPGLGPATSLPDEPGLGVRGVRGVRALPGGVGPAGPSGLWPGTPKVRRAEVE